MELSSIKSFVVIQVEGSFQSVLGPAKASKKDKYKIANAMVPNFHC